MGFFKNMIMKLVNVTKTDSVLGKYWYGWKEDNKDLLCFMHVYRTVCSNQTATYCCK